METPRVGLIVKDVRGARLGTVVFVNHCCLLLDTQHAVAAAGIFDVTSMEVELVCDANQIERYSCPIHSFMNANKER